LSNYLFPSGGFYKYFWPFPEALSVSTGDLTTELSDVPGNYSFRTLTLEKLLFVYRVAGTSPLP
jgi:hypothetical protein